MLQALDNNKSSMLGLAQRITKNDTAVFNLREEMQDLVLNALTESNVK